MTLNKIKSLFLFLMVMLSSSCVLSAREKPPYIISAEMVLEDSEVYEIAGINLYIFNQSKKNISSFTVVFFLFDEEGNPPEGIKNNIVLKIQGDIEAADSFTTCVSLDNFLYSVPEIPYELDFIYLSKIVYEDGSEWTDPFGMKCY